MSWATEINSWERKNKWKFLGCWCCSKQIEK